LTRDANFGQSGKNTFYFVIEFSDPYLFLIRIDEYCYNRDRNRKSRIDMSDYRSWSVLTIHDTILLLVNIDKEGV